MSEDKVRVWSVVATDQSGIHSPYAGNFDGRPQILVVEAAPVADLLDDLLNAAGYAPDWANKKWNIERTIQRSRSLLSFLRDERTTDG
jgi:hypothetical protein